MARITPKSAFDWCVGILIIIIFFAILFAIGMAIYAAVAEISYAQGWTNLIEAMRAVSK